MAEEKKPIKCDFCENPATIHVTQIVNGVMQKINMCEKCAQEKGLATGQELQFSDVLAEHFEKLVSSKLFQTPPQGCSKCGCTIAEFNKKGLLGCPQCYEEFKEMLSPVIPTMHKGSQHCGKVPKHMMSRKETKTRLVDLEKQLSVAIKAEHFEEAAKLRDAINSMKKPQPEAGK